ncbi:MAG: hypothetical protein A4E66_01778 [Syntrophus sp. PtaB.Bin001]|nr:MAG: hypothetical protein A4E66_01778 [Syntrophus sp. PtaB.Bin001]
MSGRDPVDYSLDLAPVRRRCIAGLGIIGAVDLDHFPGCLIFHHAFVLDDVGVSQADLPSRTEAVIFLGRVLKEVVLFNIEYLGEGEPSRSHVRILRMVGTVELFDLIVRVIVDHDPQRMQYA